MKLLLVLAVLLLRQSEDIQDLQHKNAAIRKAAAVKLGLKRDTRAVWYLIEGLKDADPEVRDACHVSLQQITGQKMDPIYKMWKDWWDEEGSKRYGNADVKEDVARGKVEIQKMVDDATTRIREDLREVRRDMGDTQGKVNIVLIGVIIVAVFFVGLMLYFAVHVGSKIKEWKELVKQADFYIKESRVVTERVDKILDELEKKKTELLEFYKKLKEGAEEEISRYSDLLQQNSDHRLREEVMELRQKAEKELEQTLSELKNALDHEMRKIAGSHKERIDREVKEEFAQFQKEVKAHSLFLEATFYFTNHRYDDAIFAYRKVLELRPDHYIAMIQIGDVYREMMKYDEAIEHYEKALKIAPNDTRACYAMAAAYAKKKDKKRMIEFLGLAFKDDGEFKDEALNDPAFREFWNDPEFKDLAEA